MDIGFNSVVDPDPDEPEIICKLGSGSESVVSSGSGFESGFKLSSVSNYQIKSCKNFKDFKN
jgi:hypothetical protein